MAVYISAQTLLTPEELIAEPIVRIDDGLIASIDPRIAAELSSGAEVYSFPGCILVPAFFDVHIHGAAGHDVMEGTPEAISAVSRFLATRGVSAYLATTVTAELDITLASLNRIAKQMAARSERGEEARVAGIHLEGPFLSHKKRGVHPADLLLPCSVAIFDRLWQAAGGQIRLMTLAPELPGAAELISHAVALGVRISLGHSDSAAESAREAVRRGATSTTHTFNAMRALDHRSPGILGVALTAEELYAEIIADGIHVDPAMVSLFWKAKGQDRAILVTDGISATGMPDGTYQLGTMEIEVAEGRCTSGGVLSGSVLTLDRAVANFRAFTGAPLSQAAALAARNPARMIGVDQQIGKIAVGRKADITVLRTDGTVAATFLSGQLAWREA